MLRDAAVDIIMKRLGNNTDTSLRDDIINEMAFVQETILEGGEFKPWFMLSEVSSVNGSASEERLALPSDFLMEYEQGALYRYDTSADNPWVELVKDDIDRLRALYSETEDKPLYYALAGDYFLLKPTPDAVYTYKMRYYKTQTSLAGTYGDAANVENAWLKHASDWFIGEVGAIIASQYLQSEVLAQRFMEQAAKGKLRVRTQHYAREEANWTRAMGDD